MYTWVIIHKLSVYKAIAQTAGTLEVYSGTPLFQTPLGQLQVS